MSTLAAHPLGNSWQSSGDPADVGVDATSFGSWGGHTRNEGGTERHGPSTAISSNHDSTNRSSSFCRSTGMAQARPLTAALLADEVHPAVWHDPRKVLLPILAACSVQRGIGAGEAQPAQRGEVRVRRHHGAECCQVIRLPCQVPAAGICATPCRCNSTVGATHQSVCALTPSRCTEA